MLDTCILEGSPTLLIQEIVYKPKDSASGSKTGTSVSSKGCCPCVWGLPQGLTI